MTGLPRGPRNSVALLELPRRRIAVLTVLMLASALAESLGLVLLVPMLAALDGSSAGGRIEAAVRALGIPLSLAPLLAIFVVLVGLRAAVNYARTLQAQRFEMDVVQALRARTWSALLHCEWRVLSAMRQSDNASLLISNIERIGFGVNQAQAALAALVTLAALGLAALAISPAVALGAAIAGIVVLAMYRHLRRRAMDLGEELGRAYREVHGETGEALAALRVIKSFGAENRAASRGTGSFASLRQAQIAFTREQARAQFALQACGALLLAILVWFAIARLDARMTQVLPLVALFARALPLVGALQAHWQNWSHARPAVEETLALVTRAEAAQEPGAGRAGPCPQLADAIILQGVSVRYPGRDRPALDRIDASFPALSMTAVTGPSGAGKSTLADLLGGLISPDEGAVSVDGVPLSGAIRRAWRSRVTYVQQEPVLFTGTIRDNLLFAAPGASEERVQRALADASATFVEALPEGLDTMIGERGRHLSGGERQRLVLARALLRDPLLLILDEAGSALDAANEAAIAESVTRLKERMTVVVIGHGGALNALADRTIAFDGGRVVPPAC